MDLVILVKEIFGESYPSAPTTPGGTYRQTCALRPSRTRYDPNKPLGPRLLRFP
jgi:hypothetical protein